MEKSWHLCCIKTKPSKTKTLKQISKTASERERERREREKKKKKTGVRP
jgi:ribosome assembly protein YihI (activator of Der GTPase)